MNIKQRTDRIIELLSNKELIPGCRVVGDSCGDGCCGMLEMQIGINARYDKNMDEIVYISGGRDLDFFDTYEIIGHPVLIGDVLKNLPFKRTNHLRATDIYILWEPCDLILPLNEIFSGEIRCEYCNQEAGISHRKHCTVAQYAFKDPNAQALLEFLEDIFKDQLK